MVPFILLFALWVALNFVDYALTKKIISMGGKELNPLIRFVGMIPAKIGFTGLLVGYYFFTGRWELFIPCDIAMGLVCGWNFWQMRK